MKQLLSLLTLVLFLAWSMTCFAMDASLDAKNPARTALEKGYDLYQSKCTLCHDGVADPEKSGKTRDDWHIVIKLMHSYGLDLTDDEATTLVDYFFTIRKGTESQPG
jgi:hypothetical protein